MIHLIRNNAYGITIGRLLYLMRHKCVYLQIKHKNRYWGCIVCFVTKHSAWLHRESCSL